MSMRRCPYELCEMRSITLTIVIKLARDLVLTLSSMVLRLEQESDDKSG